VRADSPDLAVAAALIRWGNLGMSPSLRRRLTEDAVVTRLSPRCGHWPLQPTACHACFVQWRAQSHALAQTRPQFRNAVWRAVRDQCFVDGNEETAALIDREVGDEPAEGETAIVLTRAQDDVVATVLLKLPDDVLLAHLDESSARG